MKLSLIPCDYSKSGDSIRFTTNGFLQYYVKVALMPIKINISEYEDWDNWYTIEFDEQHLEPYGKNYFRINKINNIKKGKK